MQPVKVAQKPKEKPLVFPILHNNKKGRLESNVKHQRFNEESEQIVRFLNKKLQE